MSVSDLIVSPCRVLYSVTGTSLPADTVAAGASWGASWSELAYTDTDLTVKLVRERVEADIQESLTPILRAVGRETLEIETSLAELLPSSLALAWGGTFSQTAAGAGQPAKDELVGGDDALVTEYQWGFEGSYVSAAGNTHPIRLVVWKGVTELGADLMFGKKTKTGIPFRIVANPDMSKARGQRLYKLIKITAPASS